MKNNHYMINTFSIDRIVCGLKFKLNKSYG